MVSQDLTANTKKWTVVLMHRDPFQYAFDRPGANRAVGFDDEAYYLCLSLMSLM